MSGPPAPEALLVGAASVLVGLAVLVLPRRPRVGPAPGHLQPPPTRGWSPGRRGARDEVDPPLLLDLVAAVVSAGAAPVAAVSAVAAVLRETAGATAPAAEALEALAAGAAGRQPPRAPVDRSEGDPLAGALAALQRCLWIAEQTGAPVAALLTSSAAELRRRRRRAAALAAARLGVRVVAPLGLCTLPAFGLLAVVPVLLSLGRGLLG
ncbi:type II secretion system F family protein [Quadrisphaera setariae]|uniref:type II secretion system F family protein n=1 Tax=Quadrisphaera setariae TaxID=2593304 RepID=UPI0016504B17|nr:type II secretion system F family protein [Quadrisphaera setariae]